MVRLNRWTVSGIGALMAVIAGATGALASTAPEGYDYVRQGSSCGLVEQNTDVGAQTGGEWLGYDPDTDTHTIQNGDLSRLRSCDGQSAATSGTQATPQTPVSGTFYDRLIVKNGQNQIVRTLYVQSNTEDHRVYASQQLGVPVDSIGWESGDSLPDPQQQDGRTIGYEAILILLN